MEKPRAPLYNPLAFAGALLAIFFAWLPAFCIAMGHPGWPLAIGLIGLPLLELLVGRYQGPIPYWSFWTLRIILIGITLQCIAGALLAANLSACGLKQGRSS